jgi:hypothetical protein
MQCAIPSFDRFLSRQHRQGFATVLETTILALRIRPRQLCVLQLQHIFQLLCIIRTLFTLIELGNMHLYPIRWSLSHPGMKRAFLTELLDFGLSKHNEK